MKKLLIVLVLMFPSSAVASNPPAKVASAKAVQAYRQATHAHSWTYKTNCHKTKAQSWWYCTSKVNSKTYNIRVRGNYAKIDR